MFTLLFYFFSLLFFSSFAQKQNLELYIVDENQKPIENVYVLIAGKPITISDKSGGIKLDNHSKITLQHVSYQTIEMNTEKLATNKITMSANFKQLDEISVLPMSTLKTIFTECAKRMSENYPVGNVQYFQMSHYSLSDNKRVIELDGQLKVNVKSYLDFNHINDKYIDEYTELNRDYFEEKGSFEYNFFISPAQVFKYLNFYRFDFLTDIKAFDYYLKNNDSKHYEILFSPKEKDKFTYSGKVIIDKKDFGIHLIEADLTESEDNIRTTSYANFKAVDKYKFESEKIQLYFQKQGDKYFLESGFYISRMNQLMTTKNQHPRSFYTQTIVLKNESLSFLGKEKKISLGDLTYIVQSPAKKDKKLSKSERKVKEKVEKFILENEKNN